MRERWGLTPHQQLSPALEDKLAYFATVAGSYGMAARLAGKVGILVDDCTIHALVQRLGSRVEEQTQARLKTIPAPRQPREAPSPLALIMVDGFQVRHRGPGWGEQKTTQSRVEWHEQKVGVFYRQEQNAGGELTQKVSISRQGEAAELGERLHWEGLRHGLGSARQVVAVCDGAAWIWNLVEGRWGQAGQVLDFYHASQHVHALGEALHPQDETARRRWVDQQCHDLRHGKEERFFKRIARLSSRRAEAREAIRRERGYFETHRERMHYEQFERRGWPIGSGPVESACAQKQGRFKRPGQFWTQNGLRHLNALTEARDLNHWEEIWAN